ncbi:hypothetical protein Ancab_038914 [Ancistrocladus abbreviatus]
MRRSISGQGKCSTPSSDISKSLAHRSFCTLSSASYSISQIKLLESAAKHSISLGFFKLALEAGCEELGSSNQKSLNIDATPASSARESSKKFGERNVPAAKARASVTKSSANPKPATESGALTLRKKVQKSIKHEPASGQDKVKPEKESATKLGICCVTVFNGFE